MATLKEKIEEDFKKALKERKEIEISTLKLLRAAIFDKEREKRYKIAKENPEFSQEELERKCQLTDEEMLAVIASEIKKRKEAIFEFEKGKRKDLVEKEKAEIDVLKKYLPKELSQDEIEKIAKETIKNLGAKDIKDMGKVMKELMNKLKGRADGSLVSQIVKKLLSQK